MTYADETRINNTQKRLFRIVVMKILRNIAGYSLMDINGYEEISVSDKPRERNNI